MILLTKEFIIFLKKIYEIKVEILYIYILQVKFYINFQFLYKFSIFFIFSKLIFLNLNIIFIKFYLKFVLNSF